MEIGDGVVSAGATAVASRYFTFDDLAQLNAARADPPGYLERLRSPDWTVLDEVQRVPELLIAIKAEVDRDRGSSCRYLLTGSSNVFALPRISETLAGRVELLTLRPLAQAEIEDCPAEFLAHAFAPDLPRWVNTETRGDIIRRALAGGYPEASRRPDQIRRTAWFASYLITIVQRDVRDIANISDPAAIQRILEFAALRAAQPLNIDGLARDSGLKQTTLRRYLDLLEQVYLVTRLRSWQSNRNLRLTKAPKLLLNDSGLVAHLLHLTAEDAEIPLTQIGPLMETFVGVELQKFADWAGPAYELLHYRTDRGDEVDFVVEGPGRRLVGFEVKAANTVEVRDFRNMDALARDAGEAFLRGIVFYTGAQTLSFGRDRYAVPITALWTLPQGTLST
jgi:uncharacterized protein